MANVINKATNKFTKGLILDFSPENTGNEVLTHALNATLLTFNGNEMSLQNDMGNARVETAFLPEGYIPVGTCEFGGIIYIVSYNPLEDKSLIGCFPSPERNISSDELGMPTLMVSNSDFVDSGGNIENVSKYVLLKNDKLNPGDKFIINANKEIYEEKLKDLFVRKKLTESKKASDPDSTPELISTYNAVENPILSLNVVSIEDSGKIIYLNSTTRKYEKTYENFDYSYHILGTDLSNSGTVQQDIDEYRNVLSSGYSVFKSKTSGKLAILAELIMIDSYSVTHSIEPKQDANNVDIPNEYDVIIHTEASSEETSYRVAPKLKYYYLAKSLGKLYQAINGEPIPLFDDSGDYNGNFLETDLSTIYKTEDSTLQSQLKNTKLEDIANFDFPKPNTYHGEPWELFTEPFDKNLPSHVFTKFYENKYHIVKPYQLNNILYDPKINIKFYSAEEGFIPREILSENLYDHDLVYVVVPEDIYISSDKFTPSPDVNNIKGYEGNNLGFPISLHIKSDSIFLANSDLTYNSVKLASIKLPEINNKGLDQFPFKYEYTLVPCMNYGKLEHLAVSNKIDFSKIFDFTNSNFNIWKYRIDSNLLRLTFGAEVYDTISDKKVTGLILEFYDHRGFAGSFKITDKKSYSGIFTKIISLNSQGALSKYLVIEGKYTKSNYKRNAAITETKDENGSTIFKLNDKTVKYIDPERGWEYEGQLTDGGEFETPNSPEQTRGVSEGVYIEIMPNDCGTLYSNFLYGVKAYFEINKSGDISYEEKEQFFLYTLPFYNEYYYNCDNFNTLPGPTLDMVLTYKLDDLGIKSEYSGSNIENGYSTTKDGNNDSDKTYVEKYFSGEDLIKNDKIITDLNITKYYKYEGPTTLYLEVGLKKDYENYNLSYLPEINDCFSCDLQLISNDESDKQLTVTGGEYEGLKPDEILNYISGMNTNLNKIFFRNHPANTTIHLDSLDGMNFLSRIQYSNAIHINYNFVVGYKINISAIRKSEVPATTVCALFHKKPNGEYNYEDFGMFKSNDDILNKNIIYTGGSITETYIGIASLKNSSIENGEWDNFGLTNHKLFNFESKKSNNSSPSNMLDTTTLKNLATSLGKLVFCPPHYHLANGGTKCDGPTLRHVPRMSDEDDLDYHIDDNLYIVKRIDDYTIDNMLESSDFISGSHRQWGHPILNTCLVTQKFGNLYSEFIPMWYSDNATTNLNIPVVCHHGGDSKKYMKSQSNRPSYLGLNNSELATFNKKLLKTMENVYVYNPDYDSRTVNIGEVSTQTYNPQFISNLICTNSEFKFNNDKSLNNYITIRSFIFSTYLSDLNKYSNIELNEENNLKLQIQLNPNYTYCGKAGNPYLITALTYNTPVPQELKYEFEYTTANTISIKKEDGTIELLKGNLENNKAFYAYLNKKLIQLDVSNYIIQSDGTLTIKSEMVDTYNNNINQVNLTSAYSLLDSNQYKVNSSGTTIRGTTITINDLIYDPYSDHRIFVKSNNIKSTDERVYYRFIRMVLDDDWDYNEFYTTNPIDSSVKLYQGPCFINNVD